MKFWTEQETKLLTDNLDKNTKEIYLAYCDVYGSSRSYDSIQKKVKQLREDELYVTPGTIVEDDSGLEDAFASLLGATPAQALVLPVTNAQEKKENKEKARDWLKDLVDYGQSLNIQIPHRPRVTEGTSLCLVISDTHVGKHTNVYNLDIASERFKSIPPRLFARVTEEIDEVAILLTGDLVEGEDIYPTQANHIQCSAIEQVQRCVEGLWEMVLGIRTLFQCRVTIHSVRGNHGRVSKTANEKTNWDNVVYYVLSTIVATHGDPNIVYQAGYEEFHTFRVQDKVGMLYHYGVKHTGTPAMREKVAGWGAVKNFDFMCHGHWHEWHVGAWLGKPVIANGCMCGPDDLAQRIAREDSARQAYFKVRTGEPLYDFGWLEW